MPWTKENPPNVAKNWSDEEKSKCVAAANAVIAKKGDAHADEAIYACIAAAGKSKHARSVFAAADTIDFEAFAVGKWNGMEFSRPDLEEMAANFHALDSVHKVPLKLGHNDQQPMTDGFPALGWVTDAWVSDAGKLMLRAEGVPKIVREAIKGKLYRKVSIELDLGVEHKGKKYAYVLSGVALLGADLPAVNTLADLGHYIDGESRLAASRRTAFAAIDGSATNQRKEDEMSVTKEEMEKIFSTVIDKAVAPLNETIKAQGAELAKFSKDRDERDKTAKTEKAKTCREAVKKVLEEGVKLGAITPGQREMFTKTLGVEDDEKVVAIDLAELRKLIGGEGKGQFSRDSGKQGGDTKPERTFADDPGKELDHRVREALKKDGKLSYSAALRSELERDPDLAREHLNGA